MNQARLSLTKLRLSSSDIRASRLRILVARQFTGGCMVWFLAGQAALGQGFVNLDFEQARIAPLPVGQYGDLHADPALAFPGLTMGSNGTRFPNYTLYNNITLGSVAQVLVGPNYPNAIGYTPLQGSYSALLQFGPNPSLGTPALSQTGMVPSSARSITFLVSATHNDARVTLDGVDIPLIAIGGSRRAGDVTAFAGRQVQLMFSTTSYNGNWFYFDDVVFSPVAIPEPSALALAFVGMLLLVREEYVKHQSSPGGQ